MNAQSLATISSVDLLRPVSLTPRVQDVQAYPDPRTAADASSGAAPGAAFAETMQRHRSDKSPGADIPKPAGVSNVQAADPQPSPRLNLGDRILRGLEGAATQMQGKWKAVYAFTDLKDPSASEIISFYAKVTDLSTQTEVVTKAVAKVAQDIDQTVRTQ
ncbi:hypothetical protein [Variovorax saccharolyticus]|uniref:hypothetical protein n=1 Tax=Variovorax saccharolyticus TaxID=3053516 RepID=UPI00257898AF|nr:hypothetical protein [Variovorax sp. J31P216]MDM0030162.1 hypothetical protein [Variovorax sp. J31P216]